MLFRSRTFQCPTSKYIHYRFNMIRLDTNDGMAGETSVPCRDFVRITDDSGDRHTYCGRYYKSNTIFKASIDQSIATMNNDQVTSKWLVVETSSIVIDFQSDEIFTNFGTSMTFRCSNSSTAENNDVGIRCT